MASSPFPSHPLRDGWGGDLRRAAGDDAAERGGFEFGHVRFAALRPHGAGQLRLCPRKPLVEVRRHFHVADRLCLFLCGGRLVRCDRRADASRAGVASCAPGAGAGWCGGVGVACIRDGDAAAGVVLVVPGGARGERADAGVDGGCVAGSCGWQAGASVDGARDRRAGGLLRGGAGGGGRGVVGAVAGGGAAVSAGVPGRDEQRGVHRVAAVARAGAGDRRRGGCARARRGRCETYDCSV